MDKLTIDLDDFIAQKKDVDSDFASNFDSGYEEFKAHLLQADSQQSSSNKKSVLAKFKVAML